jgi:hypothetical protein
VPTASAVTERDESADSARAETVSFGAASSPGADERYARTDQTFANTDLIESDAATVGTADRHSAWHGPALRGEDLVRSPAGRAAEIPCWQR